MIIKDITQIGNPILRQKCKVVKDAGNKKVQQIIENLVDTLRHEELVGMAAPQIGQSVRILVTEIKNIKSRKVVQNKKDPLRVYINPKIIWQSKRLVVGYEGCGSVAYAQFFAQVRRPEKCIVEAIDEKGNKFQLKADGLLARVIQHEYDHLDGVLFTDKIWDVKGVMSRGEYVRRLGN